MYNKVEHIKAKDFASKYPTFFKKAKRNKFGAKKTIIDNMKFDSQSEGNLYAELKLQEKAGLIKSFETQKKEEMWAYGKHITNYYVDFLVYHNDGSLEYIEHKSQGTITDAWKIKYKMLEAKYANDNNVKCSINWYRGYKIIKR